MSTIQPTINVNLLIGKTIPIPAPDFIMNSIQSIHVTNTDSGRDGFQIVFSVGRAGLTDLIDYKLVKNQILNPFNRVIILVIIGTTQKVLLDGIITHHQLSISNEPGQSIFTVTGEDVSVKMLQNETPVTHENKSPLSIFEGIINSYIQYNMSPDTDNGPEISTVPDSNHKIPAQNGTDWDYISKLSKDFDYMFFIEPVAPFHNNACWKSKKTRSLDVQKPLQINIGPMTNVNSLNFQYDTQIPITVQATTQDPQTQKTVTVNVSEINYTTLSNQTTFTSNQSNVKSKQLKGIGGWSVDDIKKTAQAEVNRSVDAITGTGEMNTPSYGDILRARKAVWVIGAGKSYDGKYYVRNVTHNIKLGEYTQSFTIVREGLGTTSDIIPPL